MYLWYLDLLSLISLFLHLFFCILFFFFCFRLPCFKVASMLERCSIFYRQLVGRTVQQKVPLVQTHLLKYNYPGCLLFFASFFETIYITSFISACDRMQCDTWMCCISFYDSFYRICVQLLSFYSRIFHSLSQIINSNFSQSSAIHLTVKQNGMPQHMGYKWRHQKFVLNAS